MAAKEELSYDRQGVFFDERHRRVGLTAGHTDVSLWYVLKGDSNKAYEFDKSEFNDIRWFHLDEVPHSKSDPHMERFIQKFKGNL